MTDAPSDQGKTWLGQHLRTALANLYNPPVLRASPLTSLLGLDKDGDRAMTLRSALLSAIEAMRPNQATPRGSRTWRMYQVLRLRYTEQVSQREVASDLGLSIRQLQREEKDARDLLIDHLWDTHNLGEQVPTVPTVAGAESTVGNETENGRIAPTRSQELEWLEQSVTAEVTDLDALIRSAIETVHPLQDQMDLSLEYMPSLSLPPILIKAPLLRQALVTIIGSQAASTQGGRVRIEATVVEQEVEIAVIAEPGPGQSESQISHPPDDVDMASELLRLCGGSLSLAVQRSLGSNVRLVADLRLPLSRLTTVLVIDDNADALQLMARYLTGTRYGFVGAQSARRGMDLAAELSPQVILLDVMMPEQDGWALLGQLRAHPRTHSSAIIVCTFLAEEHLALALGATAFIRKPVRRGDLLALLDQQTGF